MTRFWFWLSLTVCFAVFVLGVVELALSSGGGH